MPTTHTTKSYGTKHAQIEVMLTDKAGETPTYGPPIDVPGIKTVTITGDIETKQLRGDNTVLDEDSTLTGMGVAFEGAKLSLDVLAAALSATVVDSGTTGDEIASLDITGDTKLRPFRFTAQSASADPILGAVVFTLHKVILSSFPELGTAEEDYKTAPAEGRAMPTLGAGRKWLTVAIHDQAPDTDVAA